MTSDTYSRQSFLGEDAQEIIEAARVGVIGLGGGGSHLVQQLAHLGFRNYILYDPDAVEESNLNRLIGATQEDARLKRPKVFVAKRIIEGLHRKPVIVAKKLRWQEDPGLLRGCDLIFGCVDGLLERRELEICARRFMIPYLDIGLGVKMVGLEAPRMTGQIVLSMPGAACFQCLGFLNERELADEAAAYGDAGPRPQVVWANGILASTAVGVAVDLLTDWTGATRAPVYLSYEGNNGTLMPHPRLRYLVAAECTHYPVDEVGQPTYQSL